jgi:hypothetical protein
MILFLLLAVRDEYGFRNGARELQEDIAADLAVALLVQQDSVGRN